MKTTITYAWTVVCLSALLTAAAVSARADEQATPTKSEKHYTGTVASVDAKDRSFRVGAFIRHRTFNVGDACVIALVDKNTGGISGLRPGQRVTVGYEDAQGVLVADRVEQKPMLFTGKVKAIDAEHHTMTLRERMLDKTFDIVEDCTVMLRNNRTGTLADVKPGLRVSVLFETPGEATVARRIDQMNATYSGDLTAIDLSDRTVKAKTRFGAKKFNLADGCMIAVNGKTDGQMRDLKLGESVSLSYDDVNGISVVNRIDSAEAPIEPMTAASDR